MLDVVVAGSFRSVIDARHTCVMLFLCEHNCQKQVIAREHFLPWASKRERKAPPIMTRLSDFLVRPMFIGTIGSLHVKVTHNFEL
jgi:hypothetical protein